MNLREWCSLSADRPVDRARLYDLLMNQVRLKREPVAVTYCDSAPPPGYRPARVPVCSILHHAEQGKKISSTIATSASITLAFCRMRRPAA